MRQHVISNEASLSKESLKEWINTKLIIEGLGITDVLDEELALVAANSADATTMIAAIISLRAHVGWSSHGHSAVDVNIYSSGGPAAEALHGNRENTDVGKFLRDYLGLDVDNITAELNEKLISTTANNNQAMLTAVAEVKSNRPGWTGA